MPPKNEKSEKLEAKILENAKQEEKILEETMKEGLPPGMEDLPSGNITEDGTTVINPGKPLYETSNQNEAIQNIITDLVSAQDLVNLPIEDVPVSIRPAMEMRKAEASAHVSRLTSLLWNQTPKRLVAISVSGPEAATNTAVGLIESHGIVFDIEKFWADVAAKVEPSMGLDRLYRQTQHNLLCEAFTDAKVEYNPDFKYASAYLPQFSEITCPTTTDLITHIRGMVAEADKTYPQDSKMLTSALKSVILEATIKHNLSNNKIPLLLIGGSSYDFDELAGLFLRFNEAKLDNIPTLNSLINLFKNSKG